MTEFNRANVKKYIHKPVFQKATICELFIDKQTQLYKTVAGYIWGENNFIISGKPHDLKTEKADRFDGRYSDRNLIELADLIIYTDAEENKFIIINETELEEILKEYSNIYIRFNHILYDIELSASQ